VSLRRAHGKGAGALLRAETRPLDEIPALNAADTDRALALAERRGRPFTRGNRAASGRRPALALLGVPLDASDPRYRAAMRRADRYRRRRVRELTVQSGGFLGSGVAALLATSARALAASTVLYTLAGEALARGEHKVSADLMTSGARLGDAARQAELTAVGLAAREASARAATRGPDLGRYGAFLAQGADHE